jgi:hypothetical protein
MIDVPRATVAALHTHVRITVYTMLVINIRAVSLERCLQAGSFRQSVQSRIRKLATKYRPYEECIQEYVEENVVC